MKMTETLEFFVKPALDQKRIENIQLVDWSKEMTSGLLIKNTIKFYLKKNIPFDRQLVQF